MDWEAILKTYPTQADEIIKIKTLRERVNRILGGVAVPRIDSPCREMQDFSPFIQVFTPVCLAVWQETTGSKPSFDMAEVLKAFISDQAVPPMPEGDLEFAEAVINNTISGFLHLLREKNAHLLPDEWHKGECPFCGSFPKIGLDYEDRRVLSCLSCGHTWRFARMKCPSCGNSGNETLGYFEAEGIEGVRVYFCRSCSRYIKISDTRVRTVLDPETEDALTLELDGLAQQEGFTPPL